ncbi:MAG: hypothetical protein ACK4UN_13815, partial [Limisphaerales bacterium]
SVLVDSGPRSTSPRNEDYSDKPKKKRAVKPTGPESLQAALESSTGRKLTGEEKRYLVKVDDLFQQCKRSRKISASDFQELGFKMKGHFWEALQIWPSVPENNYLFWLYVANAAVEQGNRLPAFMLPATDISLIQDELQEWRREKQIEDWKKTLKNAQRWTSTPGNVVGEPCELRARFFEKGVTLEWRRVGHGTFEPFKATHARQFREDFSKGTISLSAEGEWLWETFSARLDAGGTTEFPYTESWILDRLGRMFRMPVFDPLLVNPEGNPFIRSKEPLRWKLQPAETEDDDYRLWVTQPDGSPIPPLLCLIEGAPPLYVTRQTVFQGPDVGVGVLVPGRENVIPAPAIESEAGAALLHGLGIEMPPRLQQRIRTVPLTTVISCELKPTYPGSSIEQCVIKAETQSPRGEIVEAWEGYWSSVEGQTKSSREREGDPITLYDRGALRDPRAL